MGIHTGKTFRPAAGVAGLLQNKKGEILFVHNRGAKCWTVPTGTMESDDVTAEAAILREMLEELAGLTEIKVVFSLGTIPGDRGGPKGTHGWLIEIFLCEIRGQITDYLEGDEFTFKNPRQLSIPLDNLARVALRRYFRRDGGCDEEETDQVVRVEENSGYSACY